MTTAEIIILVLLIINVILTVVALFARRNAGQEKNLDRLQTSVTDLKNALAQQDAILRREINDQNAQQRKEFAEQSAQLRLEVAKQQHDNGEAIQNRLNDIRETMDKRLESLQNTNRDTLRQMSENNEKKLEQMRETVDEKLTGTLNKRFTESFTAISEQLQSVSKGLGEMQVLAGDVGSLKNVLTNVKTRGTWGELQLGALLEQMLNPSQYVHNVKVHPRRDVIVEFAVVLPADDAGGKPVYLPIDSKFPIESYTRLTDARTAGDSAAQEAEQKALFNAIKKNAATIHEKYICEPYTTNFAVMYLPTEGLYSEVSANTELCAAIQRDYHIAVMGPNTTGAFLSSLQLGFRTLAIQKRTNEVWDLLAKIKKGFGSFGTLLEKTQKRLDDATKSVSEAADRTRIINKDLEKVQALPEQQSRLSLLDNIVSDEDNDDDEA